MGYWHCDRIVLRFQSYGVEKAHPPGKYLKNKGGISAASSEETHKIEGTNALISMLQEFAWRYSRLAGPHDYSTCGICWHPKPGNPKEKKKKESTIGKARLNSLRTESAVDCEKDVRSQPVRHTVSKKCVKQRRHRPQ